MFVLAHLSDVHLAPMPPVSPRRLRNKRYFGYQSWLRRRRSIHKRHIVDSIRDDILALGPDHVAITGDMVNLALEEEFGAVRTWLDDFGPPDWITVIPGNHDAYVPVPWERGIGTWADNMSSDADPVFDGILDGAPFPFVRRRGDVAIIGLSTAVPTSLFTARGWLGRRQLQGLEALLQRLAGESLFRVVLIHHPPLPGQNEWRKAMADTRDFVEVVRRHGADLILHGHNHRQMHSSIEAADDRIPVLGVASASARSTRKRPAAHYNIYRIERSGNKWVCEVEVRRWDDDRQAVVFAESFQT